MGEGIVRESGMDMDTLLHLTRRSSKDLLDRTGNSAQYSVMTLWSPGGRMGEGLVRELGLDIDTLLYSTWRTSKDLLDSTGNSAWCHVAAWVGENGYVCMYHWIPFLCTWSYHKTISWLWKWKSLCRIRLFATPWTKQSMGFSRPEYWSGEPFPSPGDLPDLFKPRSPSLQAGCLPAEPPEKPRNTRVGRLSLPQRICPTQKSNQGLLHCRRILYQLKLPGWLYSNIK